VSRARSEITGIVGSPPAAHRMNIVLAVVMTAQAAAGLLFHGELTSRAVAFSD
jgi:hypothetical protein